MPFQASLRLDRIQVNRSELRQNLRKTLGRAKGTSVVLVTSSAGKGEEKYLIDKEYFDQLLGNLKSTIETLEIMTDRELVDKATAVAGQLEEDVRRGALRSFEDAFAED